MRENCTYGSMRGSRRKTAKSVLRVAEGRADVPCGGVSPYSTPFLILWDEKCLDLDVVSEITHTAENDSVLFFL